jgi:hypothetical protein
MIRAGLLAISLVLLWMLLVGHPEMVMTTLL